MRDSSYDTNLHIRWVTLHNHVVEADSEADVTQLLALYTAD